MTGNRTDGKANTADVNMGKLLHFLVALAKHIVVRGDCVDFAVFQNRVNTCGSCFQRSGD
jgi:hypothetical protein